jgi:hypothetical protein
MLVNDVPVRKVSSLSDHPKTVPSDQADWAGMTSSTTLELRDEFLFEECGIAFVRDEYTHNYQAKTSIRIRDLKRMQEDVGWFNDDEKNSDGIVEATDDGRRKYTLEGEIESLAHTLITDGRRHGDPSEDNLTVEYTPHDSLDEYVVLIKWE